MGARKAGFALSREEADKERENSEISLGEADKEDDEEAEHSELSLGEADKDEEGEEGNKDQ